MADGRRIVLCSYEVEGYGGSASGAYALFRRMQQDGQCVRLINFVAPQEADYYRYQFGPAWGNRQQLANVENLILQPRLFGLQPAIAARLDALQPDVLIGMSFIATVLLAQQAPAQPLLFLTSGCRQARADIENGVAADAQSLLALFGDRRRWPAQLDSRARAAVAGATLVVTHSDLVRDLFTLYYPTYAGKLLRQPIWKYDAIVQPAQRQRHHARPFAERQIDVLFVSSDWRRAIKNFPLVQQLGKRLRDLSLHVVGEGADRLAHGVNHGFVADRERLFAMMGNARVVVCPSRLDAAPGILWEAATLGCNVVASRNCGNWMVCHPQLVADRLAVDDFAECVRRAVSRSYSSDCAFFEAADSYRTLLEIIDVI